MEKSIQIKLSSIVEKSISELKQVFTEDGEYEDFEKKVSAITSDIPLDDLKMFFDSLIVSVVIDTVRSEIVEQKKQKLFSALSTAIEKSLDKGKN